MMGFMERNYENSNYNICLISKFDTQCTSTFLFQCKNRPHLRGEYNVYSTFQSHEPEFDYLKSLEIEEKINKIRWLAQQNSAHFLLSTNGKNILLEPTKLLDRLSSASTYTFLFYTDKTIKLWKIGERDKRAEGYNLKDEDGRLRDPFRITSLRVGLMLLNL